MVSETGLDAEGTRSNLHSLAGDCAEEIAMYTGCRRLPFCRAVYPSEVGSTPTRFRQRSRSICFPNSSIQA